MATSQPQRWSGSTDTTDTSTLPSWLNHVIQPPVLDYHTVQQETQEAEMALDAGKGKAKQELTDEELARSIFAEEALRNLSEYHGEYFGDDDVLHGFRAVQSNQQVMEDLDATLNVLNEEPFHHGRPKAQIFDVVIRPPANAPTRPPRPPNYSGYYGLLAAAGVSAEPVVPPPIYPSPSECGVCGEEISVDSPTLPCGHRYDINCLKDMFSANVNDETRFPPRCCGDVIPMSSVEAELSPEDLALYRAKIIEYATPFRLYCSNKQCAKFLGPREDHASHKTCNECGTRSCAACTEPAHPPEVRCKVDKSLRKTLVLGQSHGWQRCPGCRQLVERNMGCYHISCRCGAQFCYLCAAEWKTCSCTGGTSRFLRLIGMRKVRIRGNYLVNSEFGANSDGTLKRFCKRSWKGVVRVVSPAPRL